MFSLLGTRTREIGFDVYGVDYLEDLINRARESAAAAACPNVQFEIADCRELNLDRQFDIVLCLYDVIGTYVDQNENARIAATITRHLKPGGIALISVMNRLLTESRLKHSFSIAKDPSELFALRPSQTMEKTGDTFDPEYYMMDTETKIVYRKEQFSAGFSLPAELIIRDRRYLKGDIENICKTAGLEVIWSKFIRAGHWDDAQEVDGHRAKEILVYCKKS